MTSTLAVVNCSELVTLAGPPGPRRGAAMRDLAVVTDGAMLVRDGRVERVGRRGEIEPLIPAGADVVDAGGRVVMPGFVDAHTHPVFAGHRADEFERRAAGATYQQIAASGGGIRATVRRTRQASEDALVEAARRHADWFLRTGTTTLEAKSGYGLTLDDELKLLGAIRRLAAETPLRWVPTFLGAHEIPDEYRNRREAYIELLTEEMLPAVTRGRLAEYCDVFVETAVFQVAEARKILTAAKSLGLGLRIHADQLSASGGAWLAAELGAATADHCDHTTPDAWRAMNLAGVQPVLLPGAVYALGLKRYPPVREMIDAGLPVVLATDFNPGSSPTPSIAAILSLAATQMKMLPAEAITAATINAAHSLGRGHQIGSLEPGKLADFVIHDCADHRELCYWFGVEPAAAVFIGGREVWRRH
jgi:imidazolonepropionase